MSKSSSNSELKNSSPQQKSAKKLDFLLDSIETEVAELADVVEVGGPILDDKTPGKKASTISLNEGASGMDSLELEMDMFGESEATPSEEKPTDKQAHAPPSANEGASGMDSLELELDLFGESDVPPSEGEPADKQAQAALDAMSDAEGEVEAMFAKDASMGAGNTSTTETGKEAEDDDISKALEELLATREVDASKILEKRAAPKQGKPPQKPPVVEEQLSEDLFDDLVKDLESEKDEAVATAAEPAIVEEWLSEDSLADTQTRDEETGKNAGEVAAKSGSEEALADLLTVKIEALVAKLIEERLSAIAERVIKEKINKIFSSMK